MKKLTNRHIKSPRLIPNSNIIKDTKVDFVSLAAHQFKRPLSELRLSLQMLSEGDFGQMTPQQNYIVKKTHERVNMLIRLIDDLLRMTKAGGKKHTHESMPVDIEELIESIIASASEEIMRKSIDFRFQKPFVRVPKLVVNKEEMLLALQNIIDNAIKYTPVGGDITVTLTADNKRLECKVRDSGIGIPEIQKGKLFSQFFRGSNAVKVESIGSGLGLFISKNIIEAHHGKIWFESKENIGSTFFVSLPIHTSK